MSKVAIVGSRGYPRPEHITRYIQSLPLDTIIVSGGARGVDTIAADCGYKRGMNVVIFEANWQFYGKSAGFRRNYAMIEYADRVVAFHDGSSRGTAHSIALAKRMNKPLIVFHPEESE